MSRNFFHLHGVSKDGAQYGRYTELNNNNERDGISMSFRINAYGTIQVTRALLFREGALTAVFNDNPHAAAYYYFKMKREGFPTLTEASEAAAAPSSDPTPAAPAPKPASNSM